MEGQPGSSNPPKATGEASVHAPATNAEGQGLRRVKTHIIFQEDGPRKRALCNFSVDKIWFGGGRATKKSCGYLSAPLLLAMIHTTILKISTANWVNVKA